MKYRILTVDDDVSNLKATEALLEEWGYRVDTASSGEEGISKLAAAEGDFAVVLLDYQMPRMNGAITAAKMREINAETIIIVYSCDNTREALKEMYRLGAVDFINKDEDLETLKSALELACKRYDESLKLFKATVNKAYNSELLKSVGMIGQSQKMAEVAQKCLSYRSNSAPVLILGETGSGKELVAKAIHGGPKEQLFSVNCAAFADGNLVESELFGYEKGAFTGAANRKVGILEMAGTGTVFLDEVHHLSLKAQAALLRAIREKKIRRVGATVETNISCRIIAASKPDLIDRLENGTFLPDLYYRLKFLTIDVPPLRERPEDIGLLVEHFCQRFLKETGKRKSFRVKAIRILESYPWPGNVGELEGCVSQLAVNSSDSIIGPSELDQRFRDIDLQINPPSTLADLDARHRAEKEAFILSTVKTAGSQRQAAARLGMKESTLRAVLGRLEA
ncbi:MAG: sigma-54-dependent transcriptional regulator [Bacteriovoracia bacterium]